MEDINDDSGETKWRPLVSVIDAKDTQGALLDSFPNADQGRNLHQTVCFLAQVVERGKLSTR